MNLLKLCKNVVAPFAGAWIEIWLAAANGKTAQRSLPSRERGLKSGVQAENTAIIPSLPSRERGLKLCRG